MAASIGALFVNKSMRGEYMNWTIDFKGGTEIIYAFKNKATHDYTKVDPAKVRESLARIGRGRPRHLGHLVGRRQRQARRRHDHPIRRGSRRSSPRPSTKAHRSTSQAKFKDRDVGVKATWSG